MNTLKSDLNGKRFLVVEDDHDLRLSIKKILELKGAIVRDCENGLAAKLVLEEGVPFDLLLSDIRMPEIDGIELLRISKRLRPDLKVLIFTGFSEYLETHSAAELGAEGFLAKPFRLAEMVTLVAELTDTVQAPPAATLSEQSFCRVGVDEFFSTTKLISDIYIQLNETKFIKLAKEGAEIDISRLQHIKDHRVTHLFVRTEDFHKYTGLNLRLSHAVEKSDRVPDETKIKLFKHTSEMLLQQAFVMNVDKQICDQAFSMVNNTVKAVSENDNLFGILMAMQGRTDDLYSHSLNVSVQASMIATAHGWTAQSNQHKIALAALFHDIGFKELPIELRLKPRFKMSADDIRLYESHAHRGRDILKSIEGYPSDLVNIVAHHHENIDGSGYPGGLSASKIHPLAKLIHLADEFIEQLALATEVTGETPKEILMEFFETRREEFDLDLLAAAFDLYKIPRPVGLKNKAA